MAIDTLEQAAATDFTHISVVQEENLELLNWWSTHRQADKRKAASDADKARIHAFLDRVVHAGASIQLPVERRTAQAILDYWTTELIAARDADVLDKPSFTLEKFDPSKAPDLTDKPSPFRGLSAFFEADRQTFFGRERAVEELLAKVTTRSITVVSGPSGSGKSSLVLAGLIPRVREVEAILTGYQVLEPIAPGRQPLEALQRAIKQAEQKDAAGKTQPALLVIDQFEELFTLETPADRAKAYLERITAFAKTNRVIVCIREDCVEALQHSMPPGSWANDKDAYYSPPPMTPREIKDAIELPAERVGLRFAPEVIENLVKDVVGEPSALPLLQFTLQELWNNRERNFITQAVYDKVGSPRVALQRVADRTLAELGFVENEQIVERVFLKLVTPRTEHEFVRSPGTRDFLARDEANPDAVDRVLKRFVDAGLLRKQPKGDEVRDDDRFDVAHEALIRNWPWLVERLKRGWRDKEKRWQLQSAAKMYIDSGRRADYLLRGQKLDEAREHVGASNEIRELVHASDRDVERVRKAAELHGKVRIASACAIAAIVFGAGFYILSEKRHVEDIEKLVNDRAAERNAHLRLRAELQEVFDSVSRGDLGPLEKLLVENNVPAELADRIELRRPDRPPRLDPSLSPTLTPPNIIAPGPASPNLVAPDSPPTPSPTASLTDSKSRIESIKDIKQVAIANAPAATDDSCVGALWIGNRDDSKVTVFPSGDPSGKQLTLANNVRLRADFPKRDTYDMTEQIGIIPAGTTVTAIGGLQDFPRGQNPTQYWVKVRAPAEACARVFVQYVGKPERLQLLAETLTAMGVQVPKEELIQTAKGRSEIRYFFDTDRDLAARIAERVGKAMKIDLKPVSLERWPYTKPPKGTLEVWVDLTG